MEGKRKETNPGTRLAAIVRLVRPHQWIKNGLVFAAMIFGGRLLDPECWVVTAIAAFCFCLVASSIYCLNDVLDYSYDRRDPSKRKRPVASGLISRAEALCIGGILAVIGLAVGKALLLPAAFWVLVAYLILNILYCFWLKQLALVDVVVVAIGFVLRVLIGGIVGAVWLSPWILIMIFLLALFLAVAKRRHEVMLVSSAGKKEGRRSVAGYNIHFLDATLSMLAAVLLIGYIIYTLLPKEDGQVLEYLYVTALPVLCGILRYLQITIVGNRSGDPSRIVCTDPPIIISICVWLFMFIAILYW